MFDFLLFDLIAWFKIFFYFVVKGGGTELNDRYLKFTFISLSLSLSQSLCFSCFTILAANNQFI
jgi:hypothetical protein